MKCSRLKIGFLFFGMSVLMSTSTFGQDSNKKQKERKRPSVDEIFKMMDVDKNDKLSLKEVRGPLKRDFKKIDVNEDGFITKEELKKAPKPKRDNKRREQ